MTPLPTSRRSSSNGPRTARNASKGFFPATLHGALQSSAFGNGGDFFVEHSYDVASFALGGDVANVEARVYNSSKILVLGDNVGDFVFDLPLVKLLERQGKKVFYAVKARPVQNDMSMHDVERFGARRNGWRPHLHRHGRSGHKKRRDGRVHKGMLGGRQPRHREGYGKL